MGLIKYATLSGLINYFVTHPQGDTLGYNIIPLSGN